MVEINMDFTTGRVTGEIYCGGIRPKISEYINGIWVYQKTNKRSEHPIIESTSKDSLIAYVALYDDEDIVYVQKREGNLFELSYQAMPPAKFKLENENGLNSFHHILTLDKIFKEKIIILRKELGDISSLELTLRKELGDYRK